MVHVAAEVVDSTGGHVVRQFVVAAMGRISRRMPPANSARRKPPALFGAGTLARVPEAVLREHADPDDSDGDGISGRVANVPGGIGRFGWKARFASLDDAVAAAFVNELGLTTSRYPKEGQDDDGRPPEVDDASWRSVSAFVRSLGPLSPLAISDVVARRGAELFYRVDCGKCHRPTLAVGADPDGVMRRRTIEPYTDLLLHDMGPALADGIPDVDASGQEFRTPPLWGISRTGPPYLHDGRAATLHDAIVAHGGEAEASADAYRRLAASDRATLLKFVRSR